MENEPPNTIPKIDSKDYYTVMTHFYRGELGRIMIWRQRLDITTNWAIVSTTAMITFGLSAKDHTHLIFLFANFLVYLMLAIEARRYRFYDAFRARVRMLEAHFIMPVLMANSTMLQGDWRKLMSEDLLAPSFKMSHITAIVRRFRRNYLWIFLIVGLAWFVKIWIHVPNSHNFQGFLSAMIENQPIRAEVFWSLFILIYGVFVFLVAASLQLGRQNGEFASKAMHRKKWLR